MSSINRFIAIDPGSKATGWAVFEASKLQTYGLIKLRQKASLNERFRALQIQLSNVLQSFPPQECPELAVVEDQFYGFKSNPKSVRTLTLATGIIVSICQLHDCRFELVSPSTWKRGRTDGEIELALREKYGIGGKISRDELAAVGIGDWWLLNVLEN